MTTTFSPMSEQTDKILPALIEIQHLVQMPKRTQHNDTTMSKYAPLPELIELLREPMKTHKLCLIHYRQFISFTSDAEQVVNREVLVTQLTHESGQFVRTFSVLRPATPAAQAMASVETMVRRYNIKSLFNLAEENEDDDGNAGSAGAAPVEQRAESVRREQAPVAAVNPTPSNSAPQQESQNYKVFKANFKKLASEGKETLLRSFIKERLTDVREINSATKMVDEHFTQLETQQA